MQEVGVVESINAKHGTAKVVFDRKSACDSCKMCLTSSGDKMKVYVEVKNTLNAAVGDTVGVTMSDKFVLKAAFIVYLLPIILIGAGLVLFRNAPDWALITVIFAGLLIGTLISVMIDRFIRRSGKNAPTLTAILGKSASAGGVDNGTESEVKNGKDN